MDAMNVDPMEKSQFIFKYSKDYLSATFEQTDAAHKAYEKFFYEYHQDHPGVITDCYTEFLQTLGKQATRVYWEDRGATGRRV